MKKLTYLSAIIVIITLAFIFNSCKKECSGENPRARILNGGTAKADVQVQTTGGNTININNVLTGTNSEYSSFAPGISTFTINVGSISKTTTVTMETCYDYDIKIDGSNNISTFPIKR
jgi:hypothetical protein